MSETFEGLPTVMLVDALHNVQRSGGTFLTTADIEDAWAELTRRVVEHDLARLERQG